MTRPRRPRCSAYYVDEVGGAGRFWLTWSTSARGALRKVRAFARAYGLTLDVIQVRRTP